MHCRNGVDQVFVIWELPHHTMLFHSKTDVSFDFLWTPLSVVYFVRTFPSRLRCLWPCSSSTRSNTLTHSVVRSSSLNFISVVLRSRRDWLEFFLVDGFQAIKSWNYPPISCSNVSVLVTVLVRANCSLLGLTSGTKSAKLAFISSTVTQPLSIQKPEDSEFVKDINILIS